ncbi:MAG: tetratricopeptide repeat protein [Rickettsia helvetica]
MKNVILIANASSSSLKISIFEIQNKKVKDKIYNIFLEKNDNKIVFHINKNINKNRESTADINSDAVKGMIDLFEDWWKKQENLNLIATGHRIVHGGKNFNKPVIVNEKVSEDLRALIPLSPLHQPYNLQVLDLFLQKYKEISHIACFDTSFHFTNPPITKACGLPKKYYDKGIIRDGFHGLSYKYVSSHFKEMTKEDLPTKTIIAHLGSGSSLCAIKNGLSLTSSMGFSVLDGVMMGTRTGNLDSGVVYDKLGNTTKALKYYEEALNMFQELHQGNHPDIADSLNNIGLVYGQLGDISQGLKYKEEALKAYVEHCLAEIQISKNQEILENFRYEDSLARLQLYGNYNYDNNDTYIFEQPVYYLGQNYAHSPMLIPCY